MSFFDIDYSGFIIANSTPKERKKGLTYFKDYQIEKRQFSDSKEKAAFVYLAEILRDPEHEIKVKLNNKNIELNCTCRFRFAPMLCAHKIAVLYWLEDYITENKPNKSNQILQNDIPTNLNTMAILDKFVNLLKGNNKDSNSTKKVIDSITKNYKQNIDNNSRNSNQISENKPKKLNYTQQWGILFCNEQFMDRNLVGIYFIKGKISSENIERNFHLEKESINPTEIFSISPKEGIKIYQSMKKFDLGGQKHLIESVLYDDARAIRNESYLIRIQKYMLLANNLLPYFQTLFDTFVDAPVFYSVNNLQYAIGFNFKRRKFSKDRVTMTLEFKTQDFETYSIFPHFKVRGLRLPDRAKPINEWIMRCDNELFVMENSIVAALFFIYYFEEKKNIQMNRSSFVRFYQELLKDTIYEPDENSNFKLNFVSETITPDAKIKLSEIANRLLIYPMFIYEDKEISGNSKVEEILIDRGNEVATVKRSYDEEKSFMDFFRNLHPRFQQSSMQEYFSMDADEVMKRHWFLDFYHKCTEKNISIYGFEKLKKLKFNPNKPDSNFAIHSGIDWFDLEIRISFGAQTVGLKQIKKSILNNQNMVLLDDETVGILPQDFLQKWAQIFKFSIADDDEKLRLSKKHFSFFEKIMNEFENEAILDEIIESRKLIEGIEKIDKVEIPKLLQANLRDYQKEGLYWLAFLQKLNWGGCLADDMGLGKTVQMIALMLHTLNKNPKMTNLVVAPTTLMFNWEAELSKFAPTLKVKLHHGGARTDNFEEFNEFQVILTTYGTLTNDIEKFKQYRFTLAILDESQAIKNITSQRFRAVNQINADFRYVMTGTPIENNTTELFAQMQFTNPGLLGNFNFFKKNYSDEIDKKRNSARSVELNQIIKPFILTRKKEHVAKDLPPKTEMTLLCEMGEEQRKVYEGFRLDFRQKLMGEVAKNGIEKSKIYILEGLMKLRQICDSPAILNTTKHYGNESCKLDELTRHIETKTGNHKILIFSQFLGMLGLIKNKLDEMNIKYSYLDGATTDRREKVKDFQEDESNRIFLISLKAGGFGLNLTQADYVYIVDPWWNPAAEQQAIDRVHRIGQTKNVFAYKMVCKDTIEEKILTLQKRKKEIADEVLSTDTGFISALTKDDIEMLFG